MSERRPPAREPTIRTVPMPADANSNGDIFGGWILSHMDIAGGVVGAERSKGRIATVAIDAMTFHRPVNVGDVVSVYAEVVRVGRTSMDVHIETWVRRLRTGENLLVTEGKFIFVAIDDDKKPRAVDG